jgi:hypothetical protein
LAKYFIQFLEFSWDFGILGFSKILGFFQRFFGIFDEVYEDFQSNVPLRHWNNVNTTLEELYKICLIADTGMIFYELGRSANIALLMS